MAHDRGWYEELGDEAEKDLLDVQHEMELRNQQAADVRQDVINRVKAEIANNTFETSERVDVTVARLLDDLRKPDVAA